MGWWSQFFAVLRKNWILKKRRPISTLMEILLPFLVMLLLVAIHSAVKSDIVPENLRLNDGGTFRLNEQLANLQNDLETQHALLGLAYDDPTVLADFNDTIASLSPGVAARVRFFDSNSAMNSYVRGSRYGYDDPPLLYGIALLPRTDLSLGFYDYVIRANATSNGDGSAGDPRQGMTNPTRMPRVNTITRRYVPDAFETHLENGGMALQAVTDFWILNRHSANPAQPPYDANNLPLTDIRPFPTAEYVDDLFALIVEGMLGLLFCLVFMWPVTRLIKSFVEEKELRIKEGMMMMGLPSSVVWTSWMFTYLLMMAISSLLIVLVTSGSVYKHSDGFVIWLFFFLFSCAVFSFCFLVSVFFDKATMASILGSVIFLGSFFGYYAISDDGVDPSQKNAASISLTIAFGQGAVVITRLEAEQQGSNMDNLSTEVEGYSVAQSLGWMIGDTILYLLLALYLEQVIPREYGVAQPWYFIFNPRYWFPNGIFGLCAPHRPAREEVLSQLPAAGEKFRLNGDLEEPVPAEVAARDAIRLRNLRKVFPAADDSGREFVAVHGLDLDIYEGQIFALLGHNGAGKSTTINMLTGMTSVTSGVANSLGLDVATQMPLLRHMMGVCPQHDILFPELTVMEHLQLYGAIKGVSGQRLRDEADRLLVEVGLTEKRNEQTRGLSGGQMRKLSVCIALLGDSRIVVLDEPTSGMDPYSRRSTWNLLLNNRKGRIIILTTHFLDEADLLGDRIAIMRHGRLACCGSSMFLKQLYGVGYTVTIGMLQKKGGQAEAREMAARASVIQKLTLDSVPGATLTHSVAGELAFRFPFESAAHFPPYFTELDARMDELGIDTYGISVTTLEEVFLRINEQAVNDDDAAAAAVSGATPVVQVLGQGDEGKHQEIEMIEGPPAHAPEPANPPAPAVAEIVDAPARPAAAAQADERKFQASPAAPVVADPNDPLEKLFQENPKLAQQQQSLLARGTTLRQELEDLYADQRLAKALEFASDPARREAPAPELSEADKNTDWSDESDYVGLFSETNDEDAAEQTHSFDSVRTRALKEARKAQSWWALRRHIWALIMKRLMYSKRDRRAWMWQLVYPTVLLIAGILPIKYAVSPNFETITMTPTMFDAPVRFPYAFSAAADTAVQTAFNSSLDTVASAGTGYPGIVPVFAPTSGLPTETVPEFARYLLDTRGNYREAVYGAVLVDNWRDGSGADPYTHNMSLLVNTTATYGLQTFWNQLSSAALRTTLGVSGPADPSLPVDPSTPGISFSMQPWPRTDSELIFITSTIAFLFSLALSFIPGTYVSFLVKERASKTKHLQMISGVSGTSYWLSTYIWDFLNTLVPIFVMMIVLAIFEVEPLIEGENGFATFLVLVWFALSSAPVSYIMSFWFESPTTGQNLTMMYNILFGVILVITSIFLDLIDSTKDVNDMLIWFFRTQPPFCMGRALTNLSVRKNLAAGEGKIRGAFDMDVIGWELLFMVLFSFIMFGVTLIMERSSTEPRFLRNLLLCRLGRRGRPTSNSGGSGLLSGGRDPVQDDHEVLFGTASNPEQRLEALRRSDLGDLVAGSDLDVIREKHRLIRFYFMTNGGLRTLRSEDLEAMGGDQADTQDIMIAIEGLRKTFRRHDGSRKVALRNLYFGVDRGQCLGYLGINGAGKSTTMKVLTGDTIPTSGSAGIGGFDILEESGNVRHLIGYCPQFDALFDKLTAREHLVLYARIKLVPEHLIPGFVQRCIERLTLSQYQDKMAGTYSGGNKRKLSVGISIIGDPVAVFLDEPSTGVDPKSRRAMWDLISSTMRNRSVILTTHSMEECEALCSRIGILVGGVLRALGSSQRLKGTYGSGYQLDVYLDSEPRPAGWDQMSAEAQAQVIDEQLRQRQLGTAPTQLRVMAFMREHFPDHVVVEQHPDSYKFAVSKQHQAGLVPQLGDKRSLAWIFGLIESRKAEMGVNAYSVGETSLEQVFIAFAKQQDEESTVPQGL